MAKHGERLGVGCSSWNVNRELTPKFRTTVVVGCQEVEEILLRGSGCIKGWHRYSRISTAAGIVEVRQSRCNRRIVARYHHFGVITNCYSRAHRSGPRLLFPRPLASNTRTGTVTHGTETRSESNSQVYMYYKNVPQRFQHIYHIGFSSRQNLFFWRSTKTEMALVRTRC